MVSGMQLTRQISWMSSPEAFREVISAPALDRTSTTLALPRAAAASTGVLPWPKEKSRRSVALRSSPQMRYGPARDQRCRWHTVLMSRPSPKSRSSELAELVSPRKCNGLSPAQL
eukprot:Skav234179  [mRNA]  locus=scaffold1377:43263:45061:+ [translate_table: standard]